ncbi:MAG: TonB-dependent receptor [Myxococcales bacterium]|nr:TonB-dependent receptor [Myxococcales bacterium]
MNARLVLALLALLALPGSAARAQDPAEPAGEEEDSVRIIGQRLSRLAGSAHAVDKTTLEALEQDDVHRVLGQVPGAYVREEDGFGLRPNIGLRGTSAERSAKITLMEDGVLLAPAPYAAPAAYFFPLMTRMTGVEVFKGPAAIAYGPNTVGGAVNLVTRSIPRGSRGEIDVATGRFGTDKLHLWWGHGDDRFGVLVEGVHLDSDGFKRLDGGGPTGFDKREAMVKLRYGSAPEAETWQRVELKLGYADEASHATYLGLTDADFADDPFRRYVASQRGRMSWWRTQAELTWRLELGAAFELRTTAYRHDFSRAWRKLNGIRGEPALRDLLAADEGRAAVSVAVLRGEQDSDPRSPLLIGTNDRRFFSQGLQTRGSWAVDRTGALRQTLRFGVRLHQDAIERDHDEAPFDMRGGTLLRAGPDEVATSNREEAMALALDVQDEIRLGEAVTLTPGVRAELIATRYEDALGDAGREHAYAVVLPGAGVVWALSPGWSLLAGVHRGFTPVSPRSGDLADPEDSVNYEAGGRYLGRASRLELIGFLSDYRNLLVPCTLSAGCAAADVGRQFNGGAVQIRGVELLASQALRVTAGLRLQVDAAWTLTLSALEGRFDDPILGAVAPGDALPYLPVHQGHLMLRAIGQAAELDVAVHGVGAVRDVAGQGAIPARERVDGHVVLDVAAHWQVTEAARLYGRIDNVLGAEYAVSRRPYGLRPGKPTQILIGFKHRFGGEQRED